MDGWNTIVSFWGPAYFEGLWLLVSGRVAPWDVNIGYFEDTLQHPYYTDSNTSIGGPMFLRVGKSRVDIFLVTCSLTWLTETVFFLVNGM